MVNYKAKNAMLFTFALIYEKLTITLYLILHPFLHSSMVLSWC